MLLANDLGPQWWRGMIGQTQRVCVKLYAAESGIPDGRFVPIFHEWIRDRALDMVLLDVADYTHVPDSPGVMLIAHEAAFSLDRSDGRFGLLTQQRRPVVGGVNDAIATTLRRALSVADRLESDRRLAGRLKFDRTSIRVEANDRLRASNGEHGFAALEQLVRTGVLEVFPSASVRATRISVPPRERLAIGVHIQTPGDAPV
jgi:hypothetical protein